MKGLILAGGSGTRLRPLTYTGAKQLIPIANRPIIFYGIEALVQAGVRAIGIVVGETADEVRQVVGDGSRWGATIEYLPQEAPLGLAHAIKISRNFLGNEDFIMYLGDNLLKEGVVDFVHRFQQHRPDALILLTEVTNPREFGVAVVDSAGVVKQLVEKPKDPPSNLALVGIYLFNRMIFEAIEHIKPSWRNELEITDAIQWLLDNQRRVESQQVKGWWKDTGKPEDILDANALVLEGIDDVREGSLEATTVNGRVRIESGAMIQGSAIRGPVVIGRDARIRNSYIGSFTSIGPGVVVEGSELECSIVLEGAQVRNLNTRIDRSIIGKNAVIQQVDQAPRTHRFVIGDQSHVELTK